MTTSTPLPSFELNDLSSVIDPRPLYAEWRAAGPLVKGGPNQWGVTRHAEVSALLKDRRVTHGMPKAYTDFVLGDGPSSAFRQNSLLMRDGPAHLRLRHLLAQAFTPQLVRALDAHIDRLVDGMLGPLADGATCNLVDLLAFPLPTEVICELLAVDHIARDEVRTQTAALFGPDRPASDAAVIWLRGFMDDVLAKRRPDADGDLLARMLAAGDGDDALTREEIVDNAVLLFFAGFETTRHLIASGGLALAQAPGQLQRLAGDPTMQVLAVEELLRWDSPARAITCMTTEAIEIGDRVVKAGQVLHLLLDCANHDDRVFTQPEVLDVGRTPNPHVSFGGGPHRCLGMHLARLEAKVVLRRLSESFRVLELAGAPLRSSVAPSRYDDVPIRALAA
jgi:cytochrome P450